jgi:hypothetical protein
MEVVVSLGWNSFRVSDQLPTGRQGDVRGGNAGRIHNCLICFQRWQQREAPCSGQLLKIVCRKVDCKMPSAISARGTKGLSLPNRICVVGTRLVSAAIAGR